MENSQEISKHVDHFQKLPSEIVSKIFENLSETERKHIITKVCKRFRDLMCIPKLWEKVVLKNAILEPGQLSHLFFFPIGQLDLTGSNDMKVQVFLPGSEVEAPDFHLSLEKLNISKAVWLKAETQEKILKKLKPNELRFDDNFITFPVLKAIVENENLKVLSMQNATFQIPRIKISATLIEIERYINKLSKGVKLRNLIKLQLNHIDCKETSYTLAIYSNLFKSCINLKHLGMSPCTLMKPSIIRELQARLKFLESLLLCECEWEDAFKRLDFNWILRTLTSVRVLHIFDHETFHPEVRFLANKENKDGIRRVRKVLNAHGIGTRVEFANGECKIFLFRRGG